MTVTKVAKFNTSLILELTRNPKHNCCLNADPKATKVVVGLANGSIFCVDAEILDPIRGHHPLPNAHPNPYIRLLLNPDPQLNPNQTPFISKPDSLVRIPLAPDVTLSITLISTLGILKAYEYDGLWQTLSTPTCLEIIHSTHGY